MTERARSISLLIALLGSERVEKIFATAAARGDRPECEFRLPRNTEFAHRQHVEFGAQRAGDRMSNRHAASRQTEHKQARGFDGSRPGARQVLRRRRGGRGSTLAWRTSIPAEIRVSSMPIARLGRIHRLDPNQPYLRKRAAESVALRASEPNTQGAGLLLMQINVRAPQTGT
jgi:hypothetical protein